MVVTLTSIAVNGSIIGTVVCTTTWLPISFQNNHKQFHLTIIMIHNFSHSKVVRISFPVINFHTEKQNSYLLQLLSKISTSQINQKRMEKEILTLMEDQGWIPMSLLRQPFSYIFQSHFLDPDSFEQWRPIPGSLILSQLNLASFLLVALTPARHEKLEKIKL